MEQYEKPPPVKQSLLDLKNNEQHQHSQAAIDVVEVKTVKPKGNGVKESVEPEPLMPKSQEAEEEADPKITGSDNLWESSAEMHQITGKLTRPKNYKSPEQLKKEKIMKFKQEK